MKNKTKVIGEVIIPNDTPLESGKTMGELLEEIYKEEYHRGVNDFKMGLQPEKDACEAYIEGYNETN